METICSTIYIGGRAIEEAVEKSVQETLLAALRNKAQYSGVGVERAQLLEMRCSHLWTTTHQSLEFTVMIAVLRDFTRLTHKRQPRILVTCL